MISIVLSRDVLVEDGATRDGAVKGGSSTASSPDSRGGKDAPSSHKQTSSLGELNVRSVSCDRSHSRNLLTKLACCLFIVSIIVLSLVKPPSEI